MYDRLRKLGIPVKMTRTTALDSTTRSKRILEAFGNGKNVIVVSNHINAGGVDRFCDKLTFFQISIKGLSLLLCPFYIHLLNHLYHLLEFLYFHYLLIEYMP